MEYIITILLIILLCFSIKKESQNHKNIIIQNRQGWRYAFILFSGAVFIIVITKIYALFWLQYCVSALGLICLKLLIDRQGITMKGIQVVAKGKEIIYWDEIKTYEIEETKEGIVISYYNDGHMLLTRQEYPKDKKEEIIKILDDNIK